MLILLDWYEILVYLSEEGLENSVDYDYGLLVLYIAFFWISEWIRFLVHYACCYTTGIWYYYYNSELCQIDQDGSNLPGAQWPILAGFKYGLMESSGTIGRVAGLMSFTSVTIIIFGSIEAFLVEFFRPRRRRGSPTPPISFCECCKGCTLAMINYVTGESATKANELDQLSRYSLTTAAIFGTDFHESHQIAAHVLSTSKAVERNDRPNNPGPYASVEHADYDGSQVGFIHFWFSAFAATFTTVLVMALWPVVEIFYSNSKENYTLYWVFWGTFMYSWIGLTHLDATSLTLIICELDEPEATKENKPEFYAMLGKTRTELNELSIEKANQSPGTWW